MEVFALTELGNLSSWLGSSFNLYNRFWTLTGGPLTAENDWQSGGQSWIMVVNLKNISDSFGVYPGGQSEDPASPLYANYIDYWMNGTYLPLYYINSSGAFPRSLIMDTIIMLPDDGS